MRLYWTRRAKGDLLQIARFIARDNQGAANAWITKLKKKASLIVRNPWAGRMVQEAGLRNVREVLLKTYRIVYLVEAKRIIIITVFEAHRQLEL